MASATVRLTKDQANVVLQALELLMNTYGAVGSALSGDTKVTMPLVSSATEVYEVLLSAGEAAGWAAADDSVSNVSTDGDDLNVSVRVETFAERTPPPTIDPFELPEEDDITGYLV